MKSPESKSGSDDEMRIAIAKACGWEVHHGGRYLSLSPNYKTRYGLPDGLFDPLADLNAMHEAEKTLRVGGNNAIYVGELEKLLPGPAMFPLIHATARQRAIAFLKAIE